MTLAETANPQQAEHWNQAAGATWVEMQPMLDRMLAPLEQRLTRAAFPGEGRRVLDIGCGAGATTLAMARRIGPAGACLGVDISAPLIAAARARAEAEGVPATFAEADAQVHPFDPAGFEAVISRFGVMFFSDPTAAFANILTAAAPGATLTFVAWRTQAENPFMTAPMRATAHLLPQDPPPPDAPGPFAFADGDRVRRILTESGWTDVRVEPLDEPCEVAREDLPVFATRVGPLAPAIRQAEPGLRHALIQAVEGVYHPFLDGEVARFTAACWHVSARRG